jgi:hypothetical protein
MREYRKRKRTAPMSRTRGACILLDKPTSGYIVLPLSRSVATLPNE